MGHFTVEYGQAIGGNFSVDSDSDNKKVPVVKALAKLDLFIFCGELVER